MAPSRSLMPSAAVADLAARMRTFRSLGGNCEFGFVQRYCGVEPSGLLRFAYTPIDALVRGLGCGFEGFGVPGDLCIEEIDTGAFYCRSERYNIWWNTMQLVGSVAPEVLLEREYGRAAHLRASFLAELAAGSHILVRTESQGETDADFARLSAALQAHGAAPLLRVKAVGAAWKPEPVRQVGPHRFEGSVRRFAIEEAWAVDFEPWVHLCDAAYAARHDLPASALAAAPVPSPITFRTRLRYHVGKSSAGGSTPGPPTQDSHTSFMKAVDPAAFEPARVYVFSAWVWIPVDCTATRIFAACGLRRLAWRDADLTDRERWQRVWAAGRFEPGEAPGAPVGLGMIGGRQGGFWSCRSVCHEGALPRPVEPPRIRPQPAPARWITRWFDREQTPRTASSASGDVAQP